MAGILGKDNFLFGNDFSTTIVWSILGTLGSSQQAGLVTWAN